MKVYPVLAMVPEDTRETLRPYVDAMAARITDGMLPHGAAGRDAYAWGAVLSAMARALTDGDIMIEQVTP